MSEILNNWIVVINDWIWTYILIIFLIAAGLYFSFQSRFVQFRYFPGNVPFIGTRGNRKQ